MTTSWRPRAPVALTAVLVAAACATPSLDVPDEPPLSALGQAEAAAPTPTDPSVSGVASEPSTSATTPATGLPPTGTATPTPSPAASTPSSPSSSPIPTTTSPEGWLVAVSDRPAVGTSDHVRTYSVEVEPGIGWDLAEFAPVVVATLEDPDRGWTATGEVTFRQVSAARAADIRVVLASPDTVDAACATNDLDTNGIYSCFDGHRAMLTVFRWEHGARDFDSIADYRTYLVNHEVGHGLGLHHVDCPGSGQPAPIMMQQTRSVEDCEPNGWPYP